MATIDEARIKAVRTTTDAPPQVIHLPEAASQTFAVGEIVFLDSTGRVAELTGDTPDEIYGIAAEAASGTAGTQIAVYRADPTTIFEATMKEGSDTDHTAAQVDIGTTMGIQRVTGDSKVYLDADVTNANSRVFTHDFGTGNSSGTRGGGLAKSAVGDVNARVLFTFLPKHVQHLTSS